MYKRIIRKVWRKDYKSGTGMLSPLEQLVLFGEVSNELIDTKNPLTEPGNNRPDY